MGHPFDGGSREAAGDHYGFSRCKRSPVREGGHRLKTGNNPPENRFAEGFLVSEEPGAFTVFICSVSDFKDRYDSEPYAPLAAVRFVRHSDGPAHQRVDFSVLDFPEAAAAALKRLRAQFAHPESGLRFGRACLQKGLSELGDALIESAAKIPDRQSGEVNAKALLPAL